MGDSAREVTANLADGDVALLENVRFDKRETSKDAAERDSLATELAALADVYVSDGFGVVHRKQASVFDVATKLPHAVGGLVQKEVEALRKATDDPARPYAVVLGGAKVSDKLGVIENLLGKADRLLIGGGMVFTFLAAQGHAVGKSLLEEDQVEIVKGYLSTAAERGVQIVLPSDIVVAPAFAADAPASVVAADAIPDDEIGLDIGPQSQQAFREALAGREDHRVERAHGRLRVRGLRRAAPGRSRRASSTRRRPERSASSAAATRLRPCVSWTSTRPASATSRPAAGRRWNSWRARSSPVSRSWRAESRWHRHAPR